MRKKLAVLLAALTLAGCTNRPQTVPAFIQQRGGRENVDRTNVDHIERKRELERRASSGEFNASGALEAAVRAAAEAHVADRIARNDIVGTPEDMIAYHVNIWTAIAAAAAGEAAKKRLDQAVARVATVAAPNKELRPAAIELVTRQEPPPVGAERERAIRQAMDEIRSEVERRHIASLQSQHQAQEADLIRQSMSNLSDMPREIRQAAERNVVENRSPFAGTKATLPAQMEAEIRTEEARLRGAIEAGRANIAQQQAIAAAAVHRDAIHSACDAQAAAAGDSVPTPYSPRAGIFGSALAGAVQSAAVQERVRSNCYRLNGL